MTKHLVNKLTSRTNVKRLQADDHSVIVGKSPFLSFSLDFDSDLVVNVIGESVQVSVGLGDRHWICYSDGWRRFRAVVRNDDLSIAKDL